MTGWGGRGREARCCRDGKRWQRFHARDTEDGIQQRAIFGSEPRDFLALPVNLSALTGRFGFESAQTARKRQLVPQIGKSFH
jgi:hypothetical protein